MNIRLATDADLGAISRLNERLLEGGSWHQLMLDPRLPGEGQYRPHGFPVYRRWMIAEDGGEVRAGVQLHHSSIYFYGKEREFCFTDSPISEGIVNRRYALAMVQLMKGAMNYQPFLMALGGGAPTIEIYKFFVKLGWKTSLVPFFFYPVKATSVLLGLDYLKERPLLHKGALAGAYSGSGAVLSGLLALRRQLAGWFSGYEATVEPAFEDWADRVFKEAVPEYVVATRSDAATLNISYTPDNPDITRVRVRSRSTGKDAGWVVVTQKQMSDHRYFGNLKVGTLADGFGRLENISALIAAGIDHLVEAGVDLIVANFSHASWTKACRQMGMFPGPSSHFYLFTAPGAAPLLGGSCPVSHIHVCRGHSGGLWDLVDEAPQYEEEMLARSVLAS